MPAERPSLSKSSQVRAFQCRLCGRSFMKNEHLVRHVRSHTKEKPFKCANCGTCYSRQDILNRHQRDVRCRPPDSEPPASFAGNGHSVVQSSPAWHDSNSDYRLALPLTSNQAHQARRSTRSSAAPNDTTADVRDTNPTPSTFQAHRTSSSSGIPPPVSRINTPQLPNTHRGVMEDVALPSSFPNISDCFPNWNVNPDLHDDILEMDFPPFDYVWTPEQQLLPPSIDLEALQAQRVQRIWFSHVPHLSTDELYPENIFEPVSMPVTEPTSPRPGMTEIDDQYRRKLQKSLQISSYEPTVPSADLLNVWIRLYFSKVHPILPLIHAATFQPSKANASLLIAICAMGSLFTGSEQGLRHGIHLFERVHKATLLKWETLLARNQGSMISMIQSAIICQMFGMLSGSPALLLTVDAFHGPPISWARRMSLHKQRPSINIDPETNGNHLDELWRDWARSEERCRISHGLYIIDAELSSILHREPLQNFGCYGFAPTSSEEAFIASNARDWKIKILEGIQQGQIEGFPSPDRHVVAVSYLRPIDVPVLSSFTAYAILEGIGMQIRSSRTSTEFDDTLWQELQRPLLDFYHRFLARHRQGQQDPLQMSILWHAVHITAFADFDLLERAVGREGYKLSPLEHDAITAWARSDEAHRCVVHAIQIQKDIQSTTIMSELAMHVPRAIFRASLALFCRIRFGGPSQPTQSPPPTTHRGTSGLTTNDASGSVPHTEIHSALGGQSSLKTVLFAMIDLLQHVGHWELARKLAGILTTISNFAFDFS